MRLKLRVSFRVNESDLNFLGEFYTSQGLLDEKIFAFSAKINLSSEKIKDMEHKMFGNIQGGEATVLRFIPNTSEAVFKTQDCKLIYCYAKLHLPVN